MTRRTRLGNAGRPRAARAAGPGQITEDSGFDPKFAEVVDAFAKVHAVGRGTGKGFGSRALTVNGKIFAMMASRGQFVVKLPKERVDDLVASGAGKYFEPRRGRLMKEWLAVGTGRSNWVELAGEAYRFVKRG